MIEAKAFLGDNVSIVARDDDHAILKLSDESGDGNMTIYQPFEGVLIGLCDMNMSEYESQMVLYDSVEVLCIDHCKHGRFEADIGFGELSILREGQAKLDNRKRHKGRVFFPLKHFQGISIMFDLNIAGNRIAKSFDGFDVDISNIRSKFCNNDMPYLLERDDGIERIMHGLYYPLANANPLYFRIKIIELLMYLDSMEISVLNDEKKLLHYDNIEKIKMIYKQITENADIHYTIDELSKEYGISPTALKKSFKEIYGDSVYSFCKKYKMNMAASMLIKNPDMSIGSVASKVGYESAGKFSAAFKKIMGINPGEYRNNNDRVHEQVIEL